ncbi:phosphatase PAP2 family protein [Planococcus salinus]|uniref:Phosphatase PAP2 family protein n=1 Tax=Planococcus salinus TaxID=1848460 RepID=A0A3M8P6U3_9BACL|nr:phosphatase PAP2 family protein [Planococcus salinus]RNF38990.1 phosphatase PAP2 family protein [Planococcus salinus]
MQQESQKAGIAFLLLLSGLGLAGLFIVLFAEVAEEVMEEEFGLFDVLIIRLFESMAGESMDAVMKFITELGAVWFLGGLSALILGILWWKLKDKWGILFFVIAVGGGSLLTLLLKHFYTRDRPSINPEIDAIGYSFPSGHSMGSLIFYGFVIYLVIRTRQKPWIEGLTVGVLSALIFLIGMSRIYLGAHFPSDVLAGYIAGTIWLILSLIALEWIQWQSRSLVPPVHALRNILASLYRTVQKRR